MDKHIKHGIIVDERTKREYKILSGIIPAFFFPPHLYRSKHPVAFNEVFWDGVFDNIEKGISVEEQLLSAMQYYPEKIITAANLFTPMKEPEKGIVAMLIGIRHHCPTMNAALDELEKIHGELVTYNHREDQGFINQFGVYRSRTESCAVVRFHKQVLTGPRVLLNTETQLFSEHLH